jgi:DNA-binding transcriptional LysR family regulator
VKHIPFPQLQAFLAVARTNSFAAAARELGISRSAVSQSVRQLEDQLKVVLVVRTTRSVALTDAGKKLVETAGPAVSQTIAALTEVSAQPGEATGRLRLTVPRAAMEMVIAPMLPAFRARYPRVEVEVVLEDRLADVVAESYDAGIRLDEFVERDMVAVRLTDSFRFIVVGAPSYLRERGTPERPEDLANHDCITFRSGTTGALYAWELERGKKTWRVQARGGVVTNDGIACVLLAEKGLGLAYAMEPMVLDRLREGTLQRILEPYASTVPGFFLYFPSRAQRSTPLRVFVETAQEFARGTRRKTGGS